MIGFFAKRPGTSLLSLLLVFVAGILLAHQSRTQAAAPQPEAASRARVPVKAANKPPSWRDQLDLDHAVKLDGRMVQPLGGGARVIYTLDPGLQDWTRELLKSYELPYGAVVMTTVRSGRVLVMASHSSADAEVDTEQLCLTPWAPAASVFKLITASALLSRGVPGDAKVCYHGGLRGLDRSHIIDNPGLDTACRSLSHAVAKSINPIMAKLALRYLDRTSLQQWTRRYGFESEIPFDLPVNPSRARIPAGRLERGRVAAGFWHTEISPLHGAVIASVAATGGMLRWPHVVESVRMRQGQLVVPPRQPPRRVVSRPVARSLTRMMTMTTTIGTARRAFYTRRGQAYLPEIQVAGKTGSLSRKDPFLHYNWFVGFAPADQPKVAFAVLLGNPARWRIKAHTVARMLLQRHFKQRQQRRRDGPAAEHTVALVQ